MKKSNHKGITATAALAAGVIMVTIGIIGLSESRPVSDTSDSVKETAVKLSKDEKKVSKVVDKYMKALFSNDAEKYLALQPDEVIEQMNLYTALMYGTEEEYIQALSETMEYNQESLLRNVPEGVKASLSYEIVGFTTLTEEEITELSSEYEYLTIMGGDLDMTITEAKQVSVDIFLEYDDVRSLSDSIEPTFIKVDGDWYLGLDN